MDKQVSLIDAPQEMIWGVDVAGERRYDFEVREPKPVDAKIFGNPKGILARTAVSSFLKKIVVSIGGCTNPAKINTLIDRLRRADRDFIALWAMVHYVDSVADISLDCDASQSLVSVKCDIGQAISVDYSVRERGDDITLKTEIVNAFGEVEQFTLDYVYDNQKRSVDTVTIYSAVPSFVDEQTLAGMSPDNQNAYDANTTFMSGMIRSIGQWTEGSELSLEEPFRHVDETFLSNLSISSYKRLSALFQPYRPPYLGGNGTDGLNSLLTVPCGECQGEHMCDFDYYMICNFFTI